MPWNEAALRLWVRLQGFYLLPSLAIVLIVLRFAVSRRPLSPGSRGRPRLHRGLLAAMIALAALTPLVWTNFFNWHYGGFLNTHEFFHYYLGSKYAPEIGYFDLYNAVLVADAETGLKYRPPDGGLRDLRTYQPTTIDAVLAQADRHRSRFSEERWQEWVKDVTFFKSRMGPGWTEVLRDHGYNATPVWSMLVGGLLTGRVSTDSAAGMTALALLDVLLLAAALGAVAWAFGTWPALLMAVFLASSYLLAHVHLKGALLRTDFAVCLVVATCLLKKGKTPVLAGALIGYAALSRLFPAVFLFGPAVQLAFALREPAGELVAGRGARAIALARAAVAKTVPRTHVLLFTGFATAVLVLVAVSLIPPGGTARWGDFARKIALHRTTYNHWNVGFTSVAIARFDPPRSPNRSPEAQAWPGAIHYRLEDVEDRAPFIRLGQLLALALCILAVRSLPPAAALAFGFVPGFFLVAPTYYYYIVLLLPFLFFACFFETLDGTLGLAYLFLTGLLGFSFYFRWEQYFPTTYWNSVLLLGLALGMRATAWGHSHGDERGRLPAPPDPQDRARRRRI
jgi:hypothetical protein